MDTFCTILIQNRIRVIYTQVLWQSSHSSITSTFKNICNGSISQNILLELFIIEISRILTPPTQNPSFKGTYIVNDESL